MKANADQQRALSETKAFVTSTSSGGSIAREVSGRPAPSTFLLAPDFVGAAFLLAGWKKEQ